MTIAENIVSVKGQLPPGVKLVAVSKNRPVADILEAWSAGHTIFGENKAREMAEKYPALPDGIEWHFIGHLQTNKVKFIAPFVSVIESVDSLNLLQVIDREARKLNRVIPCLLQFHIAEEASKFGLSAGEAENLLQSPEFAQMNNVTLEGVMGMATFTDHPGQVRREFQNLKRIFLNLKEHYFRDQPSFREISMGMSSDFPLAVEEGSTIVRIGTTIFGSRFGAIS